MDFIMALIGKIAIGIICIGYPIILFLYLWYMPWYVIVSYFVWITSSLGSIVFLNNKNKKFSEICAPSIFLTFVFTVVFVVSIDSDHYMFDEDNIMWFVAPALNLPMLFVSGGWISRQINTVVKKRQTEKITLLQNEMEAIELDILKFKQILRNNEKIVCFLNLLKCCGADTFDIENCEEFKEVSKLVANINDKNKQVATLKMKIAEMRNDI